MKRMFGLLVPAGITILLFGCEAFLTFNLFSTLDTPATPSVENLAAMQDAELLVAVTDLLESDSFYQDIAEDDEVRAAVLDNLSEIYAGGSDADLADQQQASLLVAEIELNSTAAGEVTDDFVNVITEILDAPQESGTPEEFTETIVAQVFSDVTAENFDDTLDALLAASEAYTFYGESLDDSGEVVVPEDSNAGAVAQNAVVAILISEIVDVDGDQPELLSIEEFEAIVINDEPFPEDFALEGNPMEENLALANILNASGFEDLFPV
jgi:hypothetical protein